MAILVMLTIGLSTFSFIIETLPYFANSTAVGWDVIEVGSVALFTIE